MSTHNFHPSVLRAYDIRGVVGETIDRDDAYAVGRTAASMVRDCGGRHMVIGRDGRASSPELAAAVVDGARAAGVDVVSVGLGPTPMLYFACHELEADGGIQVTGSHNPPSHNGFKIVIGNAALASDEIQALGARAARGEMAMGDGAYSEVNLAQRYADRLLRDVALGDGVTAVWDPGNGAVAQVLDLVLRRLPGRHAAINNVVDGTFPGHHPDPSDAANMRQLQNEVVETRADIGLAFDGDGDRLGVVDARGRIVWPDQFLVLLARLVLERHPGAPVIADVKASQVLFDEVLRAGGRPEMWKSGHSLIKARMREIAAPLAGEMSGHVFFGDRWYGFDDALYAALRMLEVIAHYGIDLAAFVDALPPLVATPEIRFACDDSAKFDIVESVRSRVRGSGAAVNEIDGVRVLTDDGWWLLRASNTEPALVARREASSDEALGRLKHGLSGHLAGVGLTVEALASHSHA